MSRQRITVSRKHAQALYSLGRYVEGLRWLDVAEEGALKAISMDLAESPKRAATRKQHRATKAAKTATKNAETSAIREAVFARARDDLFARCEICLFRWASEMHHALGRVKARQSVSNCIAACSPCHRRLTSNKESGEKWRTEKQLLHFEHHGYAFEAEEMRKRLEGIVSLREATRAGVPS